MNSSIRLSLLFCLTSLFVCTVALAKPIPPKVWVSPLAEVQDKGVALMSGKFVERFRKELRKAKKFTLVGPDEQQLRVKAGSVDPRVEEAESMRASAKSALAAGDIKEAHQAFLGALQRYELGIASVRRIEPVLDTLAFIGDTALQLGQKKAAKKWFARAAAIWPEAKIDDLSTVGQKLFSRACRRALKSRRGSLRIQTRPKGAQILVNGVEVGKSPIRVRHMVDGLHYVVAIHESAGRAGSMEKVKGGRGRSKLSLSTELGPAPVKDLSPKLVAQLWSWKGGRLSRKLKRTLKKVSAATPARYLVLQRMGVSRDGETPEVEVRIVMPTVRRYVDLRPINLGGRASTAIVGAIDLARQVIRAIEDHSSNPLGQFR